MADLLLALSVPAAAGGLGWWMATLTLPDPPRRAANDNAPARVALPHPSAYRADPA